MQTKNEPDGDKGNFTPRSPHPWVDRPYPDIHRTGSWVGPIASLKASDKKRTKPPIPWSTCGDKCNTELKIHCVSETQRFATMRTSIIGDDCPDNLYDELRNFSVDKLRTELSSERNDWELMDMKK